MSKIDDIERKWAEGWWAVEDIQWLCAKLRKCEQGLQFIATAKVENYPTIEPFLREKAEDLLKSIREE